MLNGRLCSSAIEDVLPFIETSLKCCASCGRRHCLAYLAISRSCWSSRSLTYEHGDTHYQIELLGVRKQRSLWLESVLGQDVLCSRNAAWSCDDLERLDYSLALLESGLKCCCSKIASKYLYLFIFK